MSEAYDEALREFASHTIRKIEQHADGSQRAVLFYKRKDHDGEVSEEWSAWDRVEVHMLGHSLIAFTGVFSPVIFEVAYWRDNMADKFPEPAADGKPYLLSVLERVASYRARPSEGVRDMKDGMRSMLPDVVMYDDEQAVFDAAERLLDADFVETLLEFDSKDLKDEERSIQKNIDTMAQTMAFYRNKSVHAVQEEARDIVLGKDSLEDRALQNLEQRALERYLDTLKSVELADNYTEVQRIMVEYDVDGWEYAGGIGKVVPPAVMRCAAVARLILDQWPVSAAAPNT